MLSHTYAVNVKSKTAHSLRSFISIDYMILTHLELYGMDCLLIKLM